jgi:hypothetical protein
MSSTMIWAMTDAKVVVDLKGRLGEQEQTAAEQDQIAGGDDVTEHSEQLGGEVGDPGQRGEEQDPGDHRRAQTQGPCAGALPLRQLARQDGDEDDVVDAQHDFEGGQGRQRDPRLPLGDPGHPLHDPRPPFGEGRC